MAIAAVEVQVFFSAPRCGNYMILMESCFILVYEEYRFYRVSDIISLWRVGGAVTQRSAKPFRRVRLSYVPPSS